MKNRNYALLQRLPKINHDIAATHQIHAGKRGVAEDILLRKNTKVANRLADLVAAFRFLKVAPQPQRCDVGLDVLFERSSPCFGDCGFAEIGSKNLDRKIYALFCEKFDQ